MTRNRRIIYTENVKIIKNNLARKLSESIGSIYRENGFENRRAYLIHLANENDLEVSTVEMIADDLGEAEDFSSLPREVERHARTYNEGVEFRTIPLTEEGMAMSGERMDYLISLADRYVMDIDTVVLIASNLGQEHDYDRRK